MASKPSFSQRGLREKDKEKEKERERESNFEKVFCPLKVIFGIFEGIFLRIIVTPRQACDMQVDIVAIPGENDSFLFWPKAVLLGVLSVLETG